MILPVSEPALHLLILDVDGTLVDSQHLIVAAQREAFAACGLAPPTRERSLSIVGLSLREAFTALVGPAGPVEDLADAYKGAFGRLRADPTTVEPLFPDVAAVIARLSKRDDLVIGIATGKSRRGVSHLVEREGWQRVFATVQTADDNPSKPDPGMILQAMAETGVGPDATLMVGDTSFDMAMARAAGVRAIGASWGYHPVAALLEAGAETIIDGFAALETLLPSRAEAA